MFQILWIHIDIHESSNDKWPCFIVLEHKMTCMQIAKWQSMGITKWDIFVSKEKCCVVNFLVELYIILCCRINDTQDNSVLHRGIPAIHKIYGVPSTISAANCVRFIRLYRVQALNHPKAMAGAQNTCWNGITDGKWKSTCEITKNVHLWNNTRRWLREVRIGSELWAEFTWTCENIKAKCVIRIGVREV